MKRKLFHLLVLLCFSLLIAGCDKTTQSTEQENPNVSAVTQVADIDDTVDANDSLTNDVGSETVTDIDETEASETNVTEPTEVASESVSSESSTQTSSETNVTSEKTDTASSEAEVVATETPESELQKATVPEASTTTPDTNTEATETSSPTEADANIATASVEETPQPTPEPESVAKQKTSSAEDLFLDNGSGIYNYAASVISSGGTEHVFYCSNRKSTVVTDYICYRQCTMQSDGTYVYSDKQTVLKPTSGTWDGTHVCDPSVIQGSFSYNGSSYCYLMAYLGCNTTNSQENKIGLAVSNSLSGGWTKIAANPIISIPYDTAHADAFQWGVGQPSILSIDGGGNVLICYTQGTWNLTSQIASVWNLSDLNNPVCLGSATVSNNGTGDFISNADFAYSSGTLFLICDKHPFSAGTLSNVSDVSAVYSTSISNLGDPNQFASCTWSPVATIGIYSKNHNAAFFRDGYGNLASRNVLYTKADQLGTFADSLWTYRLKKSGF